MPTGAVGVVTEDPRAVSDLFFDPGRITRTTAQVVELRTAHITATLHAHVVNLRAVSLEDALDALTMRLLAHRER